MSERPTGLAALRDDERRREDADDWTEVEVEGRMSRGSEPLTLHASRQLSCNPSCSSSSNKEFWFHVQRGGRK